MEQLGGPGRTNHQRGRVGGTAGVVVALCALAVLAFEASAGVALGCALFGACGYFALSGRSWGPYALLGCSAATGVAAAGGAMPAATLLLAGCGLLVFAIVLPRLWRRGVGPVSAGIALAVLAGTATGAVVCVL